MKKHNENENGNQSKKQDWASYFQMIKKANLPWLLLLSYFLVGLIYSRISTDMVPYASKIYTGEILEMGAITNYFVLMLMVVVLFGIQVYLEYWFAYKAERQIQTLTWKHMLRMPMSGVSNQNVTTMPSRITSDPSRVTSQFLLFTSCMTSVYSVYITMENIRSDSVDMANFMLQMLGVLAIYMVVMSILCGRFTFKATKRFQDSYAALADYVTERLSNIALIKSAASEDLEMQRAEEIIRRQYRAQIYQVNVTYISTILTNASMYFFQAVTLFTAAVMVRNGSLDAAGMLTAYRYSLLLPAYLTTVMSTFLSVKEGQGGSAEICEIVASEPETFERKHSFAMEDADICFDDVSFGYDKKNVIEGVTFEIPAHKITALAGPNGAGKSTVANLLERYYVPTSGSVRFGDCPIEDIHLNEWRRSIGYMAQETILISGTLKENLSYAVNWEVTDAELQNALRVAHLESFVEKLPNGLNTDLGEMGAKLSSGERQRIGIARLVLRDPEYLILDEITSNLDTSSRNAVISSLEDLAKGRTCIIISHDMEVVRNADHIILLEDGKVHGTGTHEELMKSDTLYQGFCAAAGC